MPLGGTDWGRSGIGTYVRSIVPFLHSSLKERGAELLVLGNQREFEAYADCLKGVPCAETPSYADKPAQSALWYLSRCGSYAKKLGANVVLYPAAQRRCCIHQPIPSVAVVHDLGQLSMENKYDPLRMFYFKQIALRLIKNAAQPVAISGHTRDHMVSALGLRRDEIEVIPNGVNYSKFAPLAETSPSAAAVRQVTGLLGPYVLYPARLEHPAKNHLRLLEGFANSRLRGTHTLALSGGDWGGKALIEAKIAELGIADRVRLLGFVDEAHLPALIACADAVIMVGMTEGFGLPALEALASGRPVCAAAAAALPEVVGEYGAMCDPLSPQSISQALEKAAFDQEFRTKCLEHGPSWARKWGWDVTGSRLAEVCLKAAAQK